MEPLSAAHEAPMGRTAIGKYRIIAELGRGGMAHVYLAYLSGPSDFNKLVVLKLLRPMFANDPELRGMFFDEARLAARLAHPNVVQTYEVGSDGDDHFLTMEYLEGQSLSAIRRAEWAHPMSIALHLRILADVCAGLEYAHELTDFDGTPLKMVHRDVSPNNIFVTYDGQVKLLDFGLAKAAWNSIRTQSGVIRGTMGYISPEQILATGVDRRADIFAVGVLLWEAVTRVRMWQGMKDVAIMQAILDGAIPTPRSVNPSVPVALERICMKALARRREDRYSTASELQAEIEEFAEQFSPHVGVRDSGRFVAELFADTRERMKALVERQLVKPSLGTGALDTGSLHTRRTTTSAPPSARAKAEGEPKKETEAPAPPEPAHPEPTAQAAHAAQAEQAETDGAMLGPWRVAIAAAVLLAIIAITALVARRPPAARDERAARIHVAATPPAARLFFDGRPLAQNPATVTLERGDRGAHELRAEAPGRAAQRVKIQKRADAEETALTIELDPAPATSTPAEPPPIKHP